MRALTSLVFITLACAIQGSLSPYIIGGNKAFVNDFPYQVLVRNLKSNTICSGSILNNHNILTAAHCVYELKDDALLDELIRVDIGTIYLDTDGIILDVDSLSIYDSYEPNSNINDIALIHLKSSIKYGASVQPINLMTSDEDLDNKTCTLSGWGSKKIGEDKSNNLQKVKLTVYPQKLCEKEDAVQATQICTLDKGKEVCKGDIGSPLVVDGVQIGIVSYIEGCSRERPIVYTRVSSFIDWIGPKIKQK